MCDKGDGMLSVSLQTGNYSCLGTDCEGSFQPPACPKRPPLSSYSCDALRDICAGLDSRLVLADTNSSAGGNYVCDTCMGDTAPLSHPPKVRNLLPVGERGTVLLLSFLVCVAFAVAGGHLHHQHNREEARAASILPKPSLEPPKETTLCDYVRQHHCWLSLKHGDPQIISLRNRWLIELSCGAFAVGTAVLCTGVTVRPTAQSGCELTLWSEDGTVRLLEYVSEYPSAGLWVVAVIMPLLWGVAAHTLVSAATRVHAGGAAIVVMLAACALFVAVAFYTLYHHIVDSFYQTYMQKELTSLSVFLIAYAVRCVVAEPAVLVCVFQMTPRVYLRSASEGGALKRKEELAKMREVAPLVDIGE